MNVNTPITTMPRICVKMLASLLVRQTAKVPQIPANKCTGIAPTTSSICNLSNSGTENTTIKPPIPPMRVAVPSDGIRGSAVMDTRPAKAPFNAMVKSAFPW